MILKVSRGSYRNPVASNAPLKGPNCQIWQSGSAELKIQKKFDLCIGYRPLYKLFKLYLKYQPLLQDMEEIYGEHEGRRRPVAESQYYEKMRNERNEAFAPNYGEESANSGANFYSDAYRPG